MCVLRAVFLHLDPLTPGRRFVGYNMTFLCLQAAIYRLLERFAYVTATRSTILGR